MSELYNADAPGSPEPVSIIIGGKERRLIFDMNAIFVTEKITGIDLLKSSIDIVSFSSLRAMLYASLLHDEPKLKIEATSEWITPRNMGGIRAALVQAWYSAVHGPDEDAEEGEGEAQSVN